jgi:hypothetical protein
VDFAPIIDGVQEHEVRRGWEASVEKGPFACAEEIDLDQVSARAQ